MHSLFSAQIDVSGQLHGACHFALGKRVNWRLSVPHIQSRLFQGRQKSLICPCIETAICRTLVLLSLTSPYCLHFYYVGVKKN